MYSEAIFCVVRSIDWETIAIEKIVCCSQFPRGGRGRQSPHGEAPGLGGSSTGGRAWAGAIIVVSVGRYGQGRVGRFRIN